MLIGETLTTLRCGNQLLDLSFPVVAGIINVTPDSFYSASRVLETGQNPVELAVQMVREGARIIDIGGMSSRPGAIEVSLNEELDRVLPVIQNVAIRLPDTVISVDTYRSEVAEAAIRAGATMINDISGGEMDIKMKDVLSRYPVSYVLMHMRGRPYDMQTLTVYQDLIGDLLKFFVNKLRELHRLNIRDIIIDPGFGFSKTPLQNYHVIDQLRVFKMLGKPLMVGISRKSTLSHTIGRPSEETLDATTALHMVSLLNGANILRTHDVKPAMDAIAVYNKLQEYKNH